MQNLELSNASGLDDSILNTYSSCCGIDAYSNGDGMTPEQKAELAKAGGQLAAQLLKSKGSKTDLEKKIKAVCGRKPIGLFSMGKKGKKRIEKYKSCADNVLKSENKPDTNLPSPPTPKISSEKAAMDKEDDKFLGMPKGLGITVAVVGGLAILVGGFFLIKKFRNQ